MALLALFQPDPYARARFTDALGDHHDLRFGSTWPDLWEIVLDHPVAGCIVDPYNAFDPLGLTELQHFKRRFPAVALVVYGDFQGREMDLYHLGRLGAEGVIPVGRDDGARALRSRVELALSCCLAKRVGDALEGALPGLGVKCVRWAVEHAENEPRVRDLAAAVRLSPRLLSRELRAMGISSPRVVLLWGRMFQAARHFEEPGTTVEEVAFRLGYATGASLGRALRNHAGFPPSPFISGERGVEDVLEAFLASLSGETGERTEGGPQWTAETF